MFKLMHYQTLWEVARIRYLPDRPKRVQVHLFTGATWEELQFAKEDKGVIIEDMIMDLLYDLPDDDDNGQRRTRV